MNQGTQEWFQARLGKVTASRVADLMAKTKSGSYASSRDNYMAQLVLERLTNTQAESYSNSYMQWGTEQEPFARAAYEASRGVMVEEVGFVPHPTIDAAGASPDGLVDDGMLEIKCPSSATMIEVLLTGNVEKKYFCQMQMQMACTSRLWCDYVVFDPRMPLKVQMFVKRIPRDIKFIAEMEAEIVKFLADVEAQLNKLTQLIESK